jgi:hypothetical protein
MSCVATYSTGQSSISEKPRILEARFPRRTLLSFSATQTKHAQCLYSPSCSEKVHSRKSVFSSSLEFAGEGA